MSPRLQWLSSRELCMVLVRLGFEVVATRGSDAKLRRAGPEGLSQTLTIPLHRELAAGTLRAIFRQACRFVPEGELGPMIFS